MAFGLFNIIKPAAVSLSDPLSEAVTCGLKKIATFFSSANFFSDNHLATRSVKIGLEVLAGSALGFFLGMSFLEIGIVLSIGVFSKLLTYAIKFLGFGLPEKQHAAHRCIKLAIGLLLAGLLVLVNPASLVHLTPIGLFAAAIAPGIIGLLWVFINFYWEKPRTEKTPLDENKSPPPTPFAVDADEVAKKAEKIENTLVPKQIISGLVVLDTAKNDALKEIQRKEENEEADPENVTQDNLASLSENGIFGVGFCYLSDCGCTSEDDREAFLAQLLRIPNGCFVINNKNKVVYNCATQNRFSLLLLAYLRIAECIVISSAPDSKDQQDNPIYTNVDTMLNAAKEKAPESAQIFVVRNKYEQKGDGPHIRGGGTVEYYAPRGSSLNWEITKKFDLLTDE